ncbi:hypothetical protein OGAPHI_002327 [Ogataea philodendri]|uniref:Uncharacterized protein n=1 Tax=Ogataea philodendri TaxID=1378263 RepID=A0A9P8PAA2_9ASCO|nr:uncharacterized protein OGAPHI_002327 [Ogataea philodendri]KAH3668573.1 hypothetical protein OGAPHI_002327 [Ogataea philodendri]
MELVDITGPISDVADDSSERQRQYQNYLRGSESPMLEKGELRGEYPFVNKQHSGRSKKTRSILSIIMVTALLMSYFVIQIACQMHSSPQPRHFILEESESSTVLPTNDDSAPDILSTFSPQAFGDSDQDFTNAASGQRMKAIEDHYNRVAHLLSE